MCAVGELQAPRCVCSRRAAGPTGPVHLNCRFVLPAGLFHFKGRLTTLLSLVFVSLAIKRRIQINRYVLLVYFQKQKKERKEKQLGFGQLVGRRNKTVITSARRLHLEMQI